MTAVRLIKKLAAYLNGIDVSAFNVGDVIDLPDSAARMLIAEGWAEPLDNPQLAKKSSLQFSTS
jgi:hypothetical protein